MNAPDQIPVDLQCLCEALLRGLRSILGENLYGVYLYGALAFPEAGPTGDIDFHVILRDTLGSKEKSDLGNLHATLARDFPPLGAELDGYYILLRDSRRTAPPAHQLVAGVKDNSWALHREHLRAGRCIVLHGPDPKQVFPAASWAELADALQEELDYVANHLAEYPDYCVLNLCRLMFSYDTQDVVVSKRASADWAAVTFPEWGSLIESANKSYARQATLQDYESLRTQVTGFYDFACEQIQQSKQEISVG